MSKEQSREQEDSRPSGLQQLLDEIQAAVAAPLSAIPEIAESETLRRAAERLQQSQKELYETLKESYPSIVVNQVARERLRKAVIEAREDAEATAETARLARGDLRKAVLDAIQFGLSEHYVARLAGVPREAVRQWSGQEAGSVVDQTPEADSDSRIVGD